MELGDFGGGGFSVDFGDRAGDVLIQQSPMFSFNRDFAQPAALPQISIDDGPRPRRFAAIDVDALLHILDYVRMRQKPLQFVGVSVGQLHKFGCQRRVHHISKRHEIDVDEQQRRIRKTIPSSGSQTNPPQQRRIIKPRKSDGVN